MSGANNGVQNLDLCKLKEFFDPDDLEWMPKKCTKQNNEYKVLVLPYMDRRAVMDRLDSVCGPENWQDDYFPGPNGGVMCKLSIRINGEWITKSDAAENTNIESIKGGITDAFKRAATKWGIGRYLAQFPKMFGIVSKYGSEWTKYKDGSSFEFVRFDIPPIPAKWLPKNSKPQKEIKKEQPVEKKITDQEAIRQILSIFEADQKGKKLLGQDYIDKWIPRTRANKPPEQGWVYFLQELINFIESQKSEIY